MASQSARIFSSPFRNRSDATRITRHLLIWGSILAALATVPFSELEVDVSPGEFGRDVEVHQRRYQQQRRQGLEAHEVDAAEPLVDLQVAHRASPEAARSAEIASVEHH